LSAEDRPSPACVSAAVQPVASHQPRSAVASSLSGLIAMALREIVLTDTPAPIIASTQCLLLTAPCVIHK